MSITSRALHYVFKIGDRARNIFFFRDILGMQVLRHEEFKEGCDAQCNGPYENRWSKTMIGYGPESTHFVMELTYNYGVKHYDLGNVFGGITIKSSEAIQRAKTENYPYTEEGNFYVLKSPDGYKFYIANEPQPDTSDPVVKVSLNVSNIATTRNYYNVLLCMQILKQTDQSLVLSYGKEQCSFEMTQISEPLNHSTAYGRTAFAIGVNLQEKIQEIMTKASIGSILKPLVTLETPGKANVRVIILADPDGHEICFVDEEGFSELSQVDPEASKLLEKSVRKDPFQKPCDEA